MSNCSPLLKKRWLYLGLFCLINFFTGAIYIWSVFSGPLAAYLNTLNPAQEVTVATLGSVFGLATGVTPLLMLTGGFINDRFGPRLIIMVGGLCLAAGYFLSALATSVSALYWSYGILAGAGTGLVNGCTINSAVKFFPDKRGFAGGTVTACLGIGGALLPFLANALIDTVGIVSTLNVFGVLLGSVVVCSALPLVKCPDGFSQIFAPRQTAETTRHDVNCNWLGMVKSHRFYPLFFMFAIVATMGLMLLSNISGIAKNQIGIGSTLIALCVSTLSLANTGGRFLSGVLSDRFGRMQTLTAMLLVAMAALALLYSAEKGDVTQFFIGLAGVGLCFGSAFGIYPGLVADEFGPKHNSVNFSVMAFSYSIGGFFGPMIIRSIGAGQHYDTAYQICMGICVLGLLCVGWFLALRKKS